MWKILLPVVGVPALLVGGAQGYIWYTTKQDADQLISMLAPFARVTYRSVHASLLGSVGLDDVRITPNDTSDQVDIRAIRIEAPSIITLYTLDSYFSAGRLPPGLAIKVQDLRAGLYSDFIMKMQGTALVSAEEACSLLGRPGPEQLEAMGYNEFRTNLTLSYTYDETNGQLGFTLAQNTADMFDISLDWRLLARLPDGAMAALQTTPPQLIDAGLTFMDRSLTERRLEFCANQRGQSVTEFVQAQSTAAAAELAAAGISVSPALLDAYARFLDQPEQIELRIIPASPLDLSELALYQPADLPRLLNLQVNVNNQPVDDLRITFKQPPPSPAAVADTASPNSTNSTANSASTTAPATEPAVNATAVAPSAGRSQRAFHPTPVTDLGSYVGKTVRITISNGRVYDGKLEEVGTSGIKIRSRLSGGTVTFPVPFERIKEASVLY